MVTTLSISMSDIQNESIRQTFEKESRRLLDFIRRRVPTQEDAEDVLQDVFYELVNTYRLMKPVEQMASWMFTVARNKITDRYRKKKPDSLEEHFAVRAGDVPASPALCQRAPVVGQPGTGFQYRLTCSCGKNRASQETGHAQRIDREMARKALLFLPYQTWLRRLFLLDRKSVV